jgi:CheY-like chemotaxis protein
MDIQMPIMNGYEAIKNKSLMRRIIITQSAFVFTDEEKRNCGGKRIYFETIDKK